MHRITFLGTGGGRFVILTQRRYSGGIWLEFGEEQIILDPGPGALIRSLQFNKKPNKLDAIFVSHPHLDHYSDTEVLIEAMTKGLKNPRGKLVTTKEVLSYISGYHQNGVEILTPKPGETFQVENLKVEALPTKKHAKGIGFKFFTEKGIVAYPSDTAYSPKLVENYRDSKILILNTIFPWEKEIETHLNAKKAMKIVKRVKPEKAIITHFGMTMLNANPEKNAKRIQEETGIEVIAARDGMELNLEEEKEGQATLGGF